MPYFHNVFTLPHELNPLILCQEENKRVLLDLLFRATAETLLQFGRNNPTTAMKDGGKVASIAEKPLADGIPVSGIATIDGAHYEWIGIMSPQEFDIQFTGSRYQGHLELKRTADPIPLPTVTPAQ